MKWLQECWNHLLEWSARTILRCDWTIEMKRCVTASVNRLGSLENIHSRNSLYISSVQLLGRLVPIYRGKIVNPASALLFARGFNYCTEMYFMLKLTQPLREITDREWSDSDTNCGKHFVMDQKFIGIKNDIGW